jgi:hypothetical protein
LKEVINLKNLQNRIQIQPKTEIELKKRKQNRKKERKKLTWLAKPPQLTDPAQPLAQ